MKRIWLLVFILLIFLPMEIVSQGIEGEKAIAFYIQMAEKDARYEHSLQLDLVEDEADFWKDQKNFELGLKQTNYNAYKAYIQGKKEAYSEHEIHCDGACDHGAYYFAQASFYALHGTSAYATISEINQERQPALESLVAHKKNF
jgi:hypothetical protein